MCFIQNGCVASAPLALFLYSKFLVNLLHFTTT